MKTYISLNLVWDLEKAQIFYLQIFNKLNYKTLKLSQFLVEELYLKNFAKNFN